MSTTAAIARTAAGCLACKCGTRLALKVVTRNMGRAKSYRLKCLGCGKESAPTFYLERLGDRWNEVAAK